MVFSPGQSSESTTSGSAGQGPLGPWGAMGSLPGLLQLLEAPVPRGPLTPSLIPSLALLRVTLSLLLGRINKVLLELKKKKSYTTM